MNAIYRSRIQALAGGLTIKELQNYNIVLVVKPCKHKGSHVYDVTVHSPGALYIEQSRENPSIGES